MNRINLAGLQLKTFTEQDASDYCQLNSINSLKVIELDLSNNKLTDISGVKLFKNLKELYLNNNKITDIFVLKNLIKLRVLALTNNNELTDISSIKFLDNLGFLSLNNNKITDISVLQYLNNLEELYIRYLKLESDQIQYIKSLKNLKELFCYEGFKDMSVLNKLNKNIRII